MQIASAAPRMAASLALLTVAALALAGAPAQAQDSEADRTVATVDGEPVTQSEVESTLQRMPPQFQQQPLELVTPMVVQQIGISRRIHAQALSEGYADDPEVAERVAEAEQGIIQDVWVERQLDELVTDEAVQAAYETYLEQNPPQDEVSARHILLESEEDALAVIEELDGGADFATLAQEKSTGPSGPAGGQLGFFGAGQMVPEFADAAFSMEPGNYSDTPVQTQFGWHVILVEDRRTTEPPTFEELEPQLANQARQDALRDLITEIQGQSEIVFMDQDGNPIEEEGEAAAEESDSAN